MPPRPGLSQSELETARVLWELGEATVREVHEAFTARRPADFTTVQTWLRRLEAKGYVKTRLEGRNRVYSARVRPKTVIRETVDDLLERLFGGDALPLMRHLIEERGITDDNLAELRRLLDELSEETND